MVKSCLVLEHDAIALREGRDAMTSHFLPHHARYPYSPLIERADYDWLGGKRLAFLHHHQY